MILRKNWIGTLTLPLVLTAQLSRAVSAQDCNSWNLVDDPPELTFYQVTDSGRGMEVLMTGRLLKVEEAPSLKAYIPRCPNEVTGFFKGKVYAIAVDQVLIGQDVRAGETLLALFLLRAGGADEPDLKRRAELKRQWELQMFRWRLAELQARLDASRDKQTVVPPEPPKPAELEPKLTETEILSYYERTGQFPQNTSDKILETGPAIPTGEPLLFALSPVNFVDPKGNTYWVGAKELSAGRQFYNLNFYYELSRNQAELQVIRRYMEISKIENPDQQVRQLAQYSLGLLRDRGLPQKVTLGAIENIAGYHSNWRWGKITQRLGEPPNERVLVAPGWRFTAYYLTADERQELLQMLTDRSRSPEFRQRLMRLFYPAIMDRKSDGEMPNIVSEGYDAVHVKRFNYGIDTFVQILQDASEDSEFRGEALRLLEELSGAEVEDALERILLQKPVGETEEEIHRWIRNTLSNLRKADQ